MTPQDKINLMQQTTNLVMNLAYHTCDTAQLSKDIEIIYKKMVELVSVVESD